LSRRESRESSAKSARTDESRHHLSCRESRESSPKSARTDESQDHTSRHELPAAAVLTSRQQPARHESQLLLSRKSTIKLRKRNDCRLSAAKKRKFDDYVLY